MSFIDLGLVVFVAVFIFIFYRLGFWVLLKSFIAFVASIILGSILLNPTISLLASFGASEDLFVPILSLTFLVIILWGFILSLLMLIFPKNYSALPDYASALMASVFAIVIYFLLILLVPRFIATGPVIDDLSGSILYRSAKNSNLISNFKNKFLGSIMHPVVISREDSREMKLNFEISKTVSDLKSCDNLFSMLNSTRRGKNIGDLIRDSQLDKLAQDYAYEIIKTKRFSHFSTSNQSPEERAIAANIKFNYLGENLAVAPNAAMAHESLLESPEHRENIEFPLYKKVGISCIDLGVGEQLFVEEFSN